MSTADVGDPFLGTIFDWLKSQVTSTKRFDWFREGYKFLNFRAGFYLKWSKRSGKRF
jgi:hypothetical protein